MKANFYHKELANGGWAKLSFAEQMANIGSEIERTINWKKRGRDEHSQESFFRALELMDFTIADTKKDGGKLKELCRTREGLVDYFFGENEYKSSDEIWQKYFRAFGWLASLQRGV